MSKIIISKIQSKEDEVEMTTNLKIKNYIFFFYFYHHDNLINYFIYYCKNENNQIDTCLYKK